MASTPPSPRRKLIVEVVEARNLVPKDGGGTSSPYARADFDGQRRKTRTVARDLNPAWNEALEFDFPSPPPAAAVAGEGEPLEVAVLHDLRVGPTRRSNFLGRVRLDARQFVRRGEEALIYFPLKKEKGFLSGSFLNWVRGDIGLKVYYVDVPLTPSAAPPDATAPASTDEPEPPKAAEEPPTDAAPPPEASAVEQAQSNMEKENPPPEVHPSPASEDAPVMTKSEEKPPPEAEAEEPASSPPPQPTPTPMPVRQLHPPPQMEEPMMAVQSKHDLVDKMSYLFVRVVRARGLPSGARPHVRVSVGGHAAATREARRGAFFEWDETFAFPRDPEADAPEGPTLEVSVWDLPPGADVSVADDAHFLGGLCFDVADVHARDPPDGPLATQWYRLEGGHRRRLLNAGAGADLMVATWAGTQDDEAFADAWKADSPPSSATTASFSTSSRAKVYVSPKLWLLRLTVIETQLQDTPPARDAGVVVRAVLGRFQALKTRTTAAVARSSNGGGPAWNEDLLFVAAEPFTDEDRLVISLEVRHGKEASFPVGSASVSLAAVERRVDDRKVASTWLDLFLPSAVKKHAAMPPIHVHGAGRLHVRVCLDGGYNVADEPACACSDFRPSARQLWAPPMGVVELGIVGCRGLLPMRAAADGSGRGCTDAYAVAKYGPKWARTRTVADCHDPAWNEQYTWPVYDPCTVLTVGVFDDPPPSSPSPSPACSRPMGKVRIRLSTLERGRAYRGVYPLILMLPTGAKRMGDVELAVRFSTSASTMEVLRTYAQPALPAMHHRRPIPAASREPLRLAAARVTAAHLARSPEPPLRREVATWMLDAASAGAGAETFSMRKLRANWNRAAAALGWVAGAARWVEETRSWRNPTATAMAHAVLVLLAWHPDLVVPTAALHAAAVGVWRYRRRPRAPAPHPCVRASMAAAEAGPGGDREELDEEFDAVPSARPPEVVRARYDRARVVGARMQRMVGDVATQAERLQALVSWRDPRATGVFVALCVLVAVVLYVVPVKMVAVVAGFYYLRHPMFRDRRPSPVINFFRRLPSMSERII